ncbi:hypothetical protein GCM10023321_45690 [Pseudonocardia eucalypti]|uniref:Right handed beta helix domain-containing protein n=1 Tax=Pseudonocardia eucalypti TaxID=648755 RepID=A0ABP9QGK0_9PSEU|nr:parallel beta-helix repeat protein [Pseudonocardia eucalypti]
MTGRILRAAAVALLLLVPLNACTPDRPPFSPREVAAPGKIDPVRPCIRQPEPAELPESTRARATFAGGRIRLTDGRNVTLTALSRAVGNPAALRQVAPGEWLLGAGLDIMPGASVYLAAPEVRWLKLRSGPGAFVAVKALGGALRLNGTCVTGWDPAAQRADTEEADGRAFLLARDGGRMEVDGSELRFLGYGENESYGLSWRTEGSGGHVRHSVVSNLHFGFYSYGVTGLTVQDSEFHDNTLYGIDPHTGSRKLLIERNVVHDNGKHGIILAEDCTDSVIRGNVLYRNHHHGIVLYQGSNRNTVEDNESFRNTAQGININESAENTVRGNRVYQNGESGIGVGATSATNLVERNEVRANEQDGIRLVSDATQTQVRANIIGDNARYGVYVDGGGPFEITGNTIFGSQVGMMLKNTDQQPAGDNTMRDNREGDLLVR